MAAAFKRVDSSLGLADQIKGQKPDGERKPGRRHDRVGCECGLMAAAAALIPLEPAAVDEPMREALAARTTEAI